MSLSVCSIIFSRHSLTSVTNNSPSGCGDSIQETCKVGAVQGESSICQDNRKKFWTSVFSCRFLLEGFSFVIIPLVFSVAVIPLVFPVAVIPIVFSLVGIPVACSLCLKGREVL